MKPEEKDQPPSLTPLVVGLILIVLSAIVIFTG